jgi:hypothetical protein
MVSPAPEVDKVEEVSGLLDQMVQDVEEQEAAVAALQRNPNIPEGTPLGETDLGGGASVKWQKQSSMVRHGDTPMPERFPAYRRDNTIAMLPTIQMLHHLGKKDSAGNKVFSGKPWPGVVPPQAIEQTCHICTPKLQRRHGQDAKKRFMNIVDYEAHMDIKHEREWGIMQRELLEAERADDRTVQRELGQAILAATKANQPKPRTMKRPEGGAVCAWCDKVTKNATGLVVHQRMHCPNRLQHAGEDLGQEKT